MADTERYPSEYNQAPEFETARDKLFSSLADRLVQVQRELGDHEGAAVWQAKVETQSSHFDW